MTVYKRIFDIVGTLMIFAVLWPILLWFVLLLLIREGRPLFHYSERMKSPTESFYLIKLRTMRPAPAGEGDGVTGGDTAGRMSHTQRLARRWRADELPQLWNVLRGDISLIGPRPPLRKYVRDYPEIYGQVLKSRPGLTGLATITFHPHEEWLLRGCKNAAQTDAVYRRRCIPRKARIDLIYQQRRTVWWDFALAYQTAHTPWRRHMSRVRSEREAREAKRQAAALRRSRPQQP